jgi:predicted PurR-regulated permease PerM
MTLTTAQRHTLIWTAIALVIALLLWRLAPVLTPFLIGSGLAYALRPAVERLAERWPRPLAVLVVEVLALTTLLALLFLVVPILSRELPQLRDQVPQLAERLNAALGPRLAALGVSLPLDADSLRAFVARHWNTDSEGWALRIFASARLGGSYFLSLISNALLVPLVLYYLLLEWPRIARQWHELIPPRLHESAGSFVAECDKVLGQYLRGQLLMMLILAGFYSIGLALFGLNLAVPVGMLTGLLEFVPYLGFALGVVLALLSALLQFGSWYGLVAVAVVYSLGQVLENAWLTPRLVGERIGLSPLTVIFALLAFGELFGFIGVLIALPVSAVMLVAARRLRHVYLNSPLYLG